MEVRYVERGTLTRHDPTDIPALLERDAGFVWIDVPAWDEAAERLLRDTLHCHPRLLDACRERNHVPGLHPYEQHLFVVLHTPLRGEVGHVHLLELDQVVGRRYLVTVHGPLNPAVDAEQALAETRSVLDRILARRLEAGTPSAVSYALGTAVARRQRELVGAVAERLPALELQVMAGEFREPESLLEQLFLIRHELITGRTMAAQSVEVFARAAALERFVDDADRGYARDLADQFERVRSIADGEAQFLHGVIELYQTRVNTKMTVAMERLAVIAAITLPITAIASVYGMNVIVFDRTQVLHLTVVLLVMLAISALLLRWTRRQGWW